MAARSESLCRTAVNGEGSEELVSRLTHTHTETQSSSFNVLMGLDLFHRNQQCDCRETTAGGSEMLCYKHRSLNGCKVLEGRLLRFTGSWCCNKLLTFILVTWIFYVRVEYVKYVGSHVDDEILKELTTTLLNYRHFKAVYSVGTHVFNVCF